MHDPRQYDSPLGILSVGLEIPELIRLPTTRSLVKFACAARDFYEIHYDDEVARAAGLPGVIVHGSLKGAYLAQTVTRWLGPHGRLARMDVRYRAPDLPGVPYRCRGVLLRLRPDGADLDLWGEDPAGERTTTGFARIELAMTPLSDPPQSRDCRL